MNATEQRQRHTALTELRSDVDTVVDAALKAVAQQIENERKEWTQRLDIADGVIQDLKASVQRRLDQHSTLIDSNEADLARKLHRERESLGPLVMRVNELQTRIVAFGAWAEDVEAWRRHQTFWGRLRWLVTGR